MEIESLHKYINLNKLANGTTEVMFAGQPCLVIKESGDGSIWTINPVFAKLVYGANIFEDIPQCTESLATTEDAIANGLIKLHELGAFNTEVDLPEDSYAATMTQVQEEVKAYAFKNSKNIMESALLYNKVLKSIYDNTFSKYNQHITVENIKQVEQPIVPATGIFKSWQESKLNEAVNDDDYYLVDRNTKKIVRNLGQHRINFAYHKSPHAAPELAPYIKDKDHTILSGMQLNHAGYKNESVDAEHEQWKSDVKKAHPGVTLKFKGYVEDGKDNISAEDKNGRTHGVWDNDKNTGHIFKLDEDVLDESASWGSKGAFDKDMEKKHGIPTSTKVDKDGRTHYFNKEGLSTGFKDPHGGDGTYYVVHSKPVKPLNEKHLTEPELKKREEIVLALKKDPKFQSKRGIGSAFAIATAKAKEIA